VRPRAPAADQLAFADTVSDSGGNANAMRRWQRTRLASQAAARIAGTVAPEH